MTLIVEYLADAVKFEQLAAHEERPDFKAQLAKQAEAYPKLAEEQAKKLGLQPPENPH